MDGASRASLDAMGRETASELRCVAPLVVLGGARPELVGTCSLVTNGTHTIAFSSAEVLRQAGEPLAICTKLDGSQTIPVPAWVMGRQPGIGIIELGTTRAFTDEVRPLDLGSVCATVDTRGAPSCLVIIVTGADGTFTRRAIQVHVDAVDGGGMSDDVLSRLVSPLEPADLDLAVDGRGLPPAGSTAGWQCGWIDGSPLFTWMPPDPVLGRPSEVVIVALGVRYRANTFKPRELPALAELVGLEDLGRALPWPEKPDEATNDLGQITGEIQDDDTGPVDVNDE